jgi:3-deoxy-D-manno-octulosonic-acid transferase
VGGVTAWGERAYEIAAAAAWTVLEHGPRWRGKWRRAVEARRGLGDRLRAWAAAHRDPGRPLVWMHAPSVGEGWQARAIAERIRAERPDVQIFYTYFSPSAERWAETFPADGRDYVPADRARDVRAALDVVRPQALVFCKLDVWPVLTREAVRSGVPVALVSAALSGRSGRRGRWARWVLRPAYARLARVGAIAAEDAERLVRLGVSRERVAVTGDARFDQVWARAQAVDAAGPVVGPLVDPARPTWVWGSTWPEDEARCLRAFARLRATWPALRAIVVPHEPTERRVADLETRLRRTGARVVRYSAFRATPWDALVVDRVGILGELYAAGDLAFVGGAFGRRGVHSVLEPAALGRPVAFGPRHGNAREAAELVAAGGAVAAPDAEALESAVRRWLAAPAARHAAGAAARAYVESKLGGAERNARLVLELLEPAGGRR